MSNELKAFEIRTLRSTNECLLIRLSIRYCDICVGKDNEQFSLIIGR